MPNASPNDFADPPSSEVLSALLHELSLPSDAAELRLLVDLCRRSRRLRSWLFGSFAGNPEIQRSFRAFLDTPQPEPMSPWSASLTRLVASLPRPSPPGTGPYGGLSETDLIAQIKTLQAPRTDIVALLLVRFWLRFSAPGEGGPPAALWKPTLDFWALLLADPEGRSAGALSRAIRFVHASLGRTAGEPDFGFAASWKIHVLLHILGNPSAAYRLRDLRRALPAKYAHVDRLELLRFCQKIGLRRDTTPGRPRTSSSPSGPGGSLASTPRGRVSHRIETPSGVSKTPRMRPSKGSPGP